VARDRERRRDHFPTSSIFRAAPSPSYTMARGLSLILSPESRSEVSYSVSSEQHHPPDRRSRRFRVNGPLQNPAASAGGVFEAPFFSGVISWSGAGSSSSSVCGVAPTRCPSATAGSTMLAGGPSSASRSSPAGHHPSARSSPKAHRVGRPPLSRLCSLVDTPRDSRHSIYEFSNLVDLNLVTSSAFQSLGRDSIARVARAQCPPCALLR